MALFLGGQPFLSVVSCLSSQGSTAVGSLIAPPGLVQPGDLDKSKKDDSFPNKKDCEDHLVCRPHFTNEGMMAEGAKQLPQGHPASAGELAHMDEPSLRM